MTIVDAVGHATAGVIAPAVEVTSTLAAAFGARVVHLPSPGFTVSPEVAEALLASPEVSQTLDLARGADAILCSVGVAGPHSLLVAEGFLGSAAMTRLVNRGAVGEILGHYYDEQGRTIPTGSLHPIGLTLDDLRASHLVIAVAGGIAKAEAVRSAAVGGIVDELVVDDSVAQVLLG